MVFSKGQYTFEIDALLAMIICICVTLFSIVYVLDTGLTQRILSCSANSLQYSREKQVCILVEK